ncbi:BON domain-containing protein [bacterium]|nr:BON domain-containing protein [bacterium]
MKNCPHCGRSYPDSDTFCEADGSKLVAHGAAIAPGAAAVPSAAGDQQAIECPTCGGRAEPGELICNFCGTRLGGEGEPLTGTTATAQLGGGWSPQVERGGPREFGDEAAELETEPEEESPTGHRWAGFLGYALAAVAALVAGVWLAIHLSGHRHTETPTAQASPAASPIVQQPSVTLARNMQISVRGTDLAGALQRDPAGAKAVFDANSGALLDIYKRALETDATLRDGMVVRLHVMPDGSVNGGSVMVSTAANPSLDAEVVAAAGGWKFPAVSGGAADVDYPIIFASGPGDIGALEADLSTKMASRSPGESPEYASSPAPTAVAAATPPPPPPVVATPVAPPPGPSRAEMERRARRRREELAAVRRPSRPATPSLNERVAEALARDRRFGRVRAYASPGGLVTLTGTVFDDNAKAAAARAVRNVSGVTSVVDNLTTETSQWAANQAAIQSALQAAGLTNVTAKVIGKSCYLDGKVKTELDRERAVTIAMGAAPVKVRTNLIRVDPGFFGW